MGINGDGLLVNYDPLDTAATNIGNHARNLETALDEIKRKVAEVNQYWEGDSHSAYQTAQANWDKEARDIHQALVAIGHLIHQAGGDYRGGDKKAAGYFL
ncbi:WXG100 family type VII secretion target [Streptomyces sp. NPDC002004]